MYGYKPYSGIKIIMFFTGVLTLGISCLLFHWRPHWLLFCTHKRCKLKDATKVLLIDSYRRYYVEEIKKIDASSVLPSGLQNDGVFQQKNPNGVFSQVNNLIYFENRKLRYFWNSETESFFKITGLENVQCTYFYNQRGLCPSDQKKRSLFFGKNSIKVEVKSFFHILFSEVLEPFYVFQIFSIILWYFDDYLYYALCILFMSALSLTTGSLQIRRNQKQLRDTVQDMDNVLVCRDNEKCEQIDSSELVPGDIIIIAPYGCIMQCDAVLISGNVIVNECMLTGESVPVTKIPLVQHESQELYNPKQHARSTLFCGTKVIQTRYYGGAKVKAVVVRTGFLTSKGELVRSIMFPKPVDFRFNAQIYRFIYFLFGLAVIGSVYTITLKVLRDDTFLDIFFLSLDLVTIVIPPALPAAMTVGVVYAQSRLRRDNIFCIAPRYINISGCLNCICFDKTGTLTEDDLSFAEIICTNDKNQFDLPIKQLSKHDISEVFVCLATCHGLTIIDGKIVGDPLDQKMFEATGWVLQEPEIDDSNKFDLLAPTIVKPANSSNATDEYNEIEYGILRQFPFASSMQRMSVVTRKLGASTFTVFTKGAPEVVSSLCVSDSVPHNFAEVLMGYTQKGYRVLALATKPLQGTYNRIQKAPREDIEKDLRFLGLMVMSNMLKPETTSVIRTLSAANIRSVMVTGDNVLTALSVARECSMIKPYHKVIIIQPSDNDKNDPPKLTWEYANTVKMSEKEFVHVNIDLGDVHVVVTGKTFCIMREYYPDLLKKVAVRGTVFARMGPDQKQQLIELLQSLGYYVGMCGDGANDCGALKVAHAGVSLSEAEASVASPFTSKTPNISCIPILIREGRASLTTALGILKYMACYSLTQFLAVIILYTFYSNLTDFQFLYQDLFLISMFFLFFGRTKSFNELAREAPPSNLIGTGPLCSFFGQIFLVIAFQLMILIFARSEPWFIENKINKNSSHENVVEFAISSFQMIALSFVFSKGAPYRKPIYSNYFFMASLVLATITTIYLITYPHDFVIDLFELKITTIPLSFRWFILLLSFLYFICSYLLESFVIDYLILVKLCSKKWYQSLFNSELPFEKILNETRKNLNWLPLPLSLSASLKSLEKNSTSVWDGQDEGKESNSESGISMDSPFSGSSRVD